MPKSKMRSQPPRESTAEKQAVKDEQDAANQDIQAAIAADARAQEVFAAEVDRVNAGVADAAKVTVEEGRKASHTAEQAIGIFRAKVRQFMGPWE